MAENRHLLAADSLRQQHTRTKLTESFHEQKAASAKRKVVLSEQSQRVQNHQHVTPASYGTGVEKDPKKLAKMDIPVSLDIDPFSTERYADPQDALDKLLSEKGGTRDTDSEHHRVQTKGDEKGLFSEIRSPGTAASDATAITPKSGDAGALLARAKKAETEVLTLKHQLLDTKAELKAAENRLCEKDAIIKDQSLRIDELIESRVPQDDMNDIMTENIRLQEELKENESLLAECQQMLEEYVAADEKSV
ncbi:hypothetical protein COEREDRAFT_79802 [Coemansia reversa NRRL 1564]|uniref:Uncharacterized protein n=1 Tax=Coemansia reversa (strain ATCC 12441 / NRRL 1564) TaxID=763665 RepID=A0A2G5BH03_COERN|nr:hypothetical protein COEREDRAFT_79802 [Coemansia reversa NRRL 1564]|eukprot:PIA18304.1 hypothetical protein COEREDRAFT_79802 [Coemansia reversa NRRL 1564]